MVSVTCMLETKGGFVGFAGLVGATKSVPARFLYNAGFNARPSMPYVLLYDPRRMPVTFWFSSLWTDLIISKLGSSTFLGIMGCMKVHSRLGYIGQILPSQDQE
jgi:hypothetical protein